MKLSRETVLALVDRLGLEGEPPIVRTILVSALADLPEAAKRELAEQLLPADAQALADVRTLDEWAKADDERYVTCGPQYGTGPMGSPPGWYCSLRYADDRDGHLRQGFHGPTPDAARHAAAEWVRGQVKP